MGSNDAEEAFVVRPFVGVGDVFVMLTGGDDGGVVGAVWGEGTGGRVTRSSGAWTCWMRRTNCCKETKNLLAAPPDFGLCSTHHFVGKERTREKCGSDQSDRRPSVCEDGKSNMLRTQVRIGRTMSPIV